MIRMTWPQYKRHECQIGDFIVRLSPMQAEVLLVLLLRYPDPVSRGDLIEAIWPDDNEPDTSHHCIQYHLQRLRARVGEYRIAGRQDFGWRLVQVPERASAIRR